MAVQQYKVFYGTGAGTLLTNVQTFTCRIGREKQLDQYSSSTATVVCRYPTGYASPIAALVPGTQIRVFVDMGGGLEIRQFFGYINNVTVRYGIPYSGGVGPADELTISLEGYFARAGRLSGNNYAMAAGTLNAQCTAATIASGLSINGNTQNGTSLLAATTVSGTWGDWISKALLSFNGRLVDGGGAIFLKSPYAVNATLVNFSDAANNASFQCYDNIEFDSLADNYYTQVAVSPESFGTQTVQTGAAPYRTYGVNTLNASTTQALDYANWLLTNYQTPLVAISSISCLANAQNNFDLGYLGSANPEDLIGYETAVTFRGSTISCVIEGITISVTPSQARYTYYVSPNAYNNYLILNNTTFGRLDFNRLGY